jgi:sigma-E factor negative regulatory protein RseC
MNGFYRQGEIIAVQETSAEVKLSLQGFCSGEHKCASASFAKDLSPGRIRIKAENTIGAGVGERVRIGVYAPGFYRALFFVFILPLVAIIVGCIAGIKCALWWDLPHKRDLYAGIGAILFCGISLLVSRFVDRRIHPRYTVHSRISEPLNCGSCSMLKKNTSLLS